MEPLNQALAAPAHHAVDGRDRTALDKLRRRPAMLLVEAPYSAWRPVVEQTLRAFGVEAQNPVPDHLEPDTTHLGRFAPDAAIVDHRQSQKTPRLPGVPRRLRLPAKLPAVIVLVKRDRRRHGKPPIVCHGESCFAVQRNPLRESASHATGISLPHVDYGPHRKPTERTLNLHANRARSASTSCRNRSSGIAAQGRGGN